MTRHWWRDVGLAVASGMTWTAFGAFLAGLFVIGAQSLLYALASAYDRDSAGTA